jgi:glycosyltransferase involved in cell wall biosynthesis
MIKEDRKIEVSHLHGQGRSAALVQVADERRLGQPHGGLAMTSATEARPPLLTICIPTYNRAGLLGEVLDAILGQVNESNAALVEVEISDNASPDNTAEVVRAKSQGHPQVRIGYHCQPANLGSDRNIMEVLAKGTGEYVWVLSDDDVLLPGAISKILAEIFKHPALGALCPNLYVFDADSGVMGPPLFNLDADLCIAEPDQMLLTLGRWMTFMSCVVFRREFVKQRDYIDKKTAWFPCCYLFLDVLQTGHGCLFIKQPCLAVRANHEISYDLVHVYGTQFGHLLDYAAKNGFSKSATQSVLSATARWLASTIYHFKKTCYRPNLQSRVRDSLKVSAVWRHEPGALLRVVAAIWLPFPPLAWLRSHLKRLRVMSH